MALISAVGAGFMVLLSLVALRAVAFSRRRAGVTARLAARPERPPPGRSAPVGPMLAAASPIWWRLLSRRRRVALEAGLPAALEVVARGLRSGASLRQALAEGARETTGALGEDLRRVLADLEQGADLVASLEAWAERRPLSGVRLAVAALCLGAETGGPRAQAVDGVATTLRQRLAAQAEARALATQARLSAWVVAIAPVGFCVLASAADPRSLVFLFTTPVGVACVVTGLALDAVGALWMARLTRADS